MWSSFFGRLTAKPEFGDPCFRAYNPRNEQADTSPLTGSSRGPGRSGHRHLCAALMRRTRVGKPILVTWINQFADDPDWHDSDALTVCLGEWCRTRVANR